MSQELVEFFTGCVVGRDLRVCMEMSAVGASRCVYGFDNLLRGWGFISFIHTNLTDDFTPKEPKVVHMSADCFFCQTFFNKVDDEWFEDLDDCSAVGDVFREAFPCFRPIRVVGADVCGAGHSLVC